MFEGEERIGEEVGSEEVGEEVSGEVTEEVSEVTEEKPKEEVPEGTYARFVFGSAKDWKYMIQALASILHEATFVFTPDALTLRALDPSKVALVDLYLPSTVFDEYECDGVVRAGILMDILSKIMKRGKAKQTVTMEVKERRLHIILSGKKTPVRRFGIPIIEVASEEIPEPKIPYTARVKMTSEVLDEILRDADTIADAVKFIASPDEFIIKALAEGGKALEARYPSSSEAFLEYEVTEEAEAMYGLDYLIDFVKRMADVSDIVEIRFSTAKPITLTFEIPGGGRVLFMLAPRVE
ncbi:MAG: proliferating cell nuclear antigen (pcna) [Thermoprotei archaeon]|nr:MAG: proliferating cell nuclear antigen (pcna) [Thermoprotei archaeon]